MSPSSSKVRRNTLPNYLFWVAAIALAILNAYTTIAVSRHGEKTESMRQEVIARHNQIKELKLLENRYYKESIDQLREMEMKLHSTHVNRRKQDEILPVLDDEFVITNVDGHLNSGERTVFLIVPKTGTHRLHILMTFQNQQLFDRHFDLDSGRGYRIEFKYEDDSLKMDFPGEPPFIIKANGFEFANRMGTLRHSLAGRSTFVSINQPRWKLWPQTGAVEYGVLPRFAYMSDKYELEEQLSIQFTAESSGPPTAAADDPATVLHLIEILNWGHEPTFRYKNGRYIFDSELLNVDDS